MLARACLMHAERDNFTREFDMPELSIPCPLAPALADRIRSARDELTTRWLERISARVALRKHRIFPTDSLLDHVPLLIDGIATTLEDESQAIPDHSAIVSKAMELGAMRYAQGFDEYEILKEFELLGGVVYAFVVREVQAMDEPCEKNELLVCGHRLFRAIAVIQEASVAHYLQRTRQALAEREARLRAFNRAVTHELKNQVAAILGAADLLEIDEIAARQGPQLLGVVQRNAVAMRTVLENLTELSEVGSHSRQQRRVLLPQAVAEAARQLRDRAAAANVEVRLQEMPEIEVPAAAVELALTNYLSNAIKYADPTAAARWVAVRGHLTEIRASPGREVVVEVWDNGIGVPEAKRAMLFTEGFRAHATTTGVEGSGLGLSIVRDAVEAIGGRAWATFPPSGGACFAIALPARRADEPADELQPDLRDEERGETD